jgi:hypothetical protein
MESNDGQGTPLSSASVNTVEDLKWHVDRFDKLRVSTASRSAVVLSAAALLSAGDAVLLTEVLDRPAQANDGVVTLLALTLLASAICVVFSAVRSTSALIGLKRFGDLFPEETLPTSLVFSASDTAKTVKSFDQFSQLVKNQPASDVWMSACTELWITIRQHRFRYGKLRDAVRFLRFGAWTFLLALAGIVVTGIADRF